MSEHEEPDWLAELAKGGEALQREAMRIVRAAEQLAAGGHARPLARRITRAVVDAAMGELRSASERPVVQVTAGLATAAATAPSPMVLTFSGSVTLAPARVSGQLTVQEPGLIERNLGRILALVLLAIGTAGLLGVHGQAQASVGFYAGVIFGALSLAFAIWAGHK
jgi:hypothetical protein